MKSYEVMYFDRQNAYIGIKFEGLDCLNFRAPFKDGAYLTGQALEDAIQALYPYSQEELAEMAATFTGGDEIAAKVVIQSNSV